MTSFNRILVLLVSLFSLFKNASCGLQSTVYSYNDKKVGKTIALTFDDGPHGTLTPQLLDVLKAKNVSVTFFVMGIKAQLHPEIIKRAHEEGHEIANHAWDHPVLSKIPRETVTDQLKRTTEAIEKAIQATPKTMRPPYGNTNKGLNEYIFKNEKLQVIMWSLDTLDWKRPPVNEIISKTIQRVKPGAVILCHDIHPGTIAAMPELIDHLKKAGYSFATASQLSALQAARRHLRGA